MRTAALSLMTTAAILLVAVPNAVADIPWQSNLRTAHAQAQAEGKLLLLHFYSDNCTWCEKLEQGAFKSPLVSDAVKENFVPVKVHANTSPQLAEMFKVTKFPTDVIVTTDGKTLAHSVSPQAADRYVAMLGATLPALAETRVAAEPNSATQQAATTAPNTAPVAKTTATPDVAKTAISDQVAATQPKTTAAESAASSQFTLPGATTNNAASVKLASSRSEGLNLKMPDEVITQTPDVSKLTAPSESPVTTNPTGEQQPELAMQGYCAVTVINEDQWVEGNPEFGCIHLGKLYLFTSQANLDTFLADPIPYTPVLNEIDVVRFFEERKIVPGKREWGMKDPTHNRMFFFADEAAMLHFYNHYERYVDSSIETMQKAVKEANPGT